MTASPETKPAAIGKEVEWAALLDTALSLPGSMGNTYSRFHNYSFGNMVLLAMQGVQEPVAGYRRWQSMNRHVKRGAKAKAIMQPMLVTATNEQGEKEKRLRGFKLRNSVFVLSDTEGEELPPVEPRIWDKQKVLGSLAISEVPFELINGNVAGYSYDRNVAINSVAVYPVKTLFHEISHVVHGHTTTDGQAEYVKHRGMFEFEAEASAYLVINELQLTEQADMSESRAYLQSWLRGTMPADDNIRRVFKATDTILRAGMVDSSEQQTT